MNPEVSGWERETVINFCDAEPGVFSVWTSQRHVGRWLVAAAESVGVSVAKTSRPTWEASGLPMGLLTRRYRLPNRPKPTLEQRAVMAARLKAARERKE